MLGFLDRGADFTLKLGWTSGSNCAEKVHDPSAKFKKAVQENSEVSFYYFLTADIEIQLADKYKPTWRKLHELSS